MRGARRLSPPLAAMTLAGCGGTIDAPPQDTPVVVRAALMTLAACTQRLDADGNVDERAVALFGWRPQARRYSRFVMRGDTGGMEERLVPPDRPSRLSTYSEYESSEWTNPGWQGVLNLSRNGGPIGQRTMGECSAFYYGRDPETAAIVMAAMTQRLGQPERRGQRSRGGDFLTPRWFEPEIHEVYWRLPFHDVYWVSSDSRVVTVEVKAAPNREAQGLRPGDPATHNQTEENSL